MQRDLQGVEAAVAQMVRRILRPGEEGGRLVLIARTNRYGVLAPDAALTDGRLVLDLVPVGHPPAIMGVPLVPASQHAKRIRQAKGNPTPAIVRRVPAQAIHVSRPPSNVAGGLSLAIEDAAKRWGNATQVVAVRAGVSRGRPVIEVHVRCEPAVARQACGLPPAHMGFPLVVRRD